MHEVLTIPIIPILTLLLRCRLCKLLKYFTKRVNIVKFAENFLLLTPLGTRPPHQKFRTRINIHCKDKVANRY